MPGHLRSTTVNMEAVKQEDVEPRPTNVQVPNTNCANHSAEDWPGDVGFQVKFKDYASTNNVWTYSEDRRKLYTVMGNAVPVHFVTDQAQPPGTTVCIVAVYRDPGLRLKNIRRCSLHAVGSDGKNNSRDHWMLCDNPATVYSEDEANGQRNFLTVPFEDPDRESNDLFTYRLRFMCRNSCAGSINRRATAVLFILRSPEGRDIARRVVEVKACACPRRDRQRDEMQRKRAPSDNEDGKKIYTIYVYDKERYEFLRGVKDSLESFEAEKATKKKKTATQTVREHTKN
ncbi:cellular tumor antigen p53-like [Ornithodoros turicata]|uniref:cellular tumor antigen p53-like n=1 Tax=Ornithodoros turicata TaxID=34597 RepID=UPI00313940C9